MATLSLFIADQVRLSRTGREPLRLQPFGNRTRIFATAMIAVAAAESGAGSDLFDGLCDGARIAFISGGILASIAVNCPPFITSPHRNRRTCFQ